jgi:hypothetical protein
VFTIVGITHEEFTGLNDTPPDLWVPVTMHGEVIKQDLFGAGQPRELAVIARLKPGVTAAQAEAALGSIMPRVVERMDSVRAEVLLQATPAPLSLELLAILSPVFAAFALVLIAASANVSNVMLARANVRQREIGIHLSIGASRGRVVRQLLTEGLLRHADPLTAGHRPDNEKRFGPARDGVWHRRVRKLVGQVLLAREEPDERAASLGHVVADRSAKHREALFQCGKDRPLRDLTGKVERHLAVDLCQRSQMGRKDDADHSSWLLTSLNSQCWS